MTPLLAVEAVAVDSETTGLDPARAWVVEIAGIRISGGQVHSEDSFRQLINPGQPIPESSTTIHTICDADVSDARGFAEIWPEALSFIGEAMVIGHNLGFDLAVFKRECARAGIKWAKPRTLDTRLLAQVIEPDLPDYALENLAAWLDIEVFGRHSALGDSLTCAKIFLAMIPKLRDKGIRTVAEAQRACGALTNVVDQQYQIGWVPPDENPHPFETGPVVQRIDTYPYRYRVRDVMRQPAKFVSPDSTVGDALGSMINQGISSLYVSASLKRGEHAPASAEGIITERDILRALVRDGDSVLRRPVLHYMSGSLTTVSADAFIYFAIGRMSRLGIRHLAAVDERNNIVGAISSSDLLRLRASETVSLGDEVSQFDNVQKLVVAWAKLPKVIKFLLEEGLSGREAAAVVSHELCVLTSQAAELAKIRIREDGKGGPPCEYAVAVLGSAGRGESSLALDQDNALIFTHGEPGSDEDRWFETFGKHIADILHEVGVPYCKGGVMASHAQWRGSKSTWQERIKTWVQRSKPEDLLSADIFFDLRGVSGDLELSRWLRTEAFDIAKGQVVFAKLLIESSGTNDRGLDFMGRFRAEAGRIDLKKTGLFGIVGTARALAICHHVLERSTPERLTGIKSLNRGSDHDLDALIEAQGTFLDLLIARQVKDLEQGIPVSNTVVLKDLPYRDRVRLRSSFKAVRHLDIIAHDLAF